MGFAQRQSPVAIVFDDVMAIRHLAQLDIRFVLLGNAARFALGRGGKEGSIPGTIKQGMNQGAFLTPPR